jgi:hypothetical protein
MSYLRYCVVGKDKEFAFAPVQLIENWGFELEDGLYDICDTPYQDEMCRLAMPKVYAEFKAHAYGEYFNPVTGLLVEYQPGEEGYEPDSVKTQDLEFAELAKEVWSAGQVQFSLDNLAHKIELDDYMDIMTDGEGYWSEDEDEYTDDLQHMKFRIQRIK